MASRNEWLFLAPLSLLSGIGHGITVSATSWWLKSCGISYTAIGIFNVCNAVYGLRLFWIPFFDQINLGKMFRFFGIKFSGPIQRKGFIILAVSCTATGIFVGSFANPKTSIMSLAIPIAFAAFWLSNADSIMNAYVYETLQPRDMGVSTASYRIGFFGASALALFVYENLGIAWSTIFRTAGILILVLLMSIIFAPSEKQAQVKTWEQSFVLPYKSIIKQYGSQLILIILFMAMYKAPERFTASMEQQFLRHECTLGSIGFFILKFMSTFALAFSAVKSGPLIAKYGYRGACIMSVAANACIMLCYYLHTLKMTTGYLVCIGITGGLFALFNYLTANTRALKYLILGGVLVCASLVNLKWTMTYLPFISAYLIVIIAKMISGIRASLLFSYQNGLCSKEHALTQITLMSSIERLVAGDFIQTMSGLSVDKFGWSGFYKISIALSLMPLLMVNFTPYPPSKKQEN